MFLKRNIIYLYFSFFVFQNCAPFEAIDDGAIYPYSTTPVFFSDLKLVQTEVDNAGRERFVFDFVVSYAADPRQNVGYRILYSTLSQPGICTHKTGTVNNQTNHINPQPSCTLPISDDLYVNIKLTGINGEEEERTYRF